MKKIVYLVLLGGLVSSSIMAKKIHYFPGQKEYLHKCRICHGRSPDFIPKHDSAWWLQWMEDKGKPLALKHTQSKNKDAAAMKEYFDSERYQSKIPYIEAFFKQFSQDGVVSQKQKAKENQEKK